MGLFFASSSCLIEAKAVRYGFIEGQVVIVSEQFEAE